MHKYKGVVSTLRSVHGKRFCRRLALASRSEWACLLAGVLLEYGAPVNRWMAIPFFSLVICLNIVESNVGAVLWSIAEVLLGMAQAIPFGVIVLLAFGPKLSLGLTIISIFAASFCVVYSDGEHEMARKVALSEIGIIFITAHTGQNEQSLFFFVRLMATTLLGASCALIAVLVPVPGFACWEARASARSVVRDSLGLYSSLVEAFGARDPSTFSSKRLRAKISAKTLCESLSELNSKRAYAICELRGFGLIPSFKRLAEGLNGLQFHLLGMTLALQSGTMLLTPIVMSDILRMPLKRTGDNCKAILELTTKLCNSRVVVIEKNKLLEEAKTEFNSLDQTVMMAREETYYREGAEEQSLDDLLAGANPKAYNANEDIKPLLRTMVPSYFFLFNLRMFFIETMNIVDTGKIGTIMHQVCTNGFQLCTLEQNVCNSRPQQLESDTLSQPHGATGIGMDRTYSSSRASSTDCHCEYQSSAITWWKACLNWLESHTLKLDLVNSKRAFKISLAMSVAALAGIRFNFHFAFWANISVGFIIQSYQGGSLRMANLRLQGTIIGAVYGYLAILITHNYPYMVLISLVPWVIVLSYLRFSKAFGPAGVLAGLTAAIVMLGDKAQPIEDFALVRITETFIGVFALIVVELVVWPNRAVTLLRKELIWSFVDLRDCVAAVIAAYKGTYCPEHRRSSMHDIKKLERRLKESFSSQGDLQNEAVIEPDLWNVPFPAAIYAKLVHIQGRMLESLHFMVCSLRAATEDCLTEQIEMLVNPLQTSLLALEEEVLSSLNLFQGVLQVRRDKVAQLNTNLTLDDDEENQLRGAGGTSRIDFLKLIDHFHPLSLLECRQRDANGTPLSVKSTIQAFEVNYEQVILRLIAAKRSNPAQSLLSNSAMLSFSAVTFSLQALLRATVELENAIHELLHFENPGGILDA